MINVTRPIYLQKVVSVYSPFGEKYTQSAFSGGRGWGWEVAVWHNQQKFEKYSVYYNNMWIINGHILRSWHTQFRHNISVCNNTIRGRVLYGIGHLMMLWHRVTKTGRSDWQYNLYGLWLQFCCYNHPVYGQKSCKTDLPERWRHHCKHTIAPLKLHVLPVTQRIFRIRLWS